MILLYIITQESEGRPLNVGRVTRLNSLYYSNSVNSIGPAGLTSAGSRLRDASPTRGGFVSPKEETGPLGSNIAAVFTNSDGDRAEITYRAMELWQNTAPGTGASNSDPSSQRPVLGLPFEYHPDLPSPFLNWDKIINGTETPDVLLRQPLSGTAPPTAAFPNAAPQPGSPINGKIQPGSELPGIDTGSFKANPIEPRGECKTCESRRYLDRSDDSSVSFQTPTKVNPNMAAAAVASHENEHVRHEKGKAQREDREIINQTVTFTYDVCPECGRRYVSGGTTHTTTIAKSASDDPGNSDNYMTA